MKNKIIDFIFTLIGTIVISILITMLTVFSFYFINEYIIQPINEYVKSNSDNSLIVSAVFVVIWTTILCIWYKLEKIKYK